MLRKFLGSPTFRIEDAWTDELTLSVSGGRFTLRPRVVAEVNGVQHRLKPIRRSGLRTIFEPLKFPFDEQRVESFRVLLVTSVFQNQCHEEGELTQMLFSHDPRTIHRNIQRRGALKKGKGIQLVCSLQAYLWASSSEGKEALGTEQERLKALSTSFCSSNYRLMQNMKRVTDHDIRLRVERCRHLESSINLDGPDARWYPSIKLALAQLLLLSGSVEESLKHMADVSDHQEVVLKNEPICAFNISLANSLLCAILDARRSPDFDKYCRRWEYVFRSYPPMMDMRFGTMEEFGKIYEACFLNYKLQLAREGCKDARFKEPQLRHILDTCIRVGMSQGALARLEKTIRSI